MSQVVDRWHALAKNHTSEGLHEMLADEVVFHSPVVHSPQEGRDYARVLIGCLSRINERVVYLCA